ncbi:MAG: rhomboid family intramembrane serine protease [Planctomycetota bacterium]
MDYKVRKYRFFATPFNIIILSCILSFAIGRISYESTSEGASEHFAAYFSLKAREIFNSSSFFKALTAPFITAGYWEIFVLIFFIFIIARNVEYHTGTLKIARIFFESYFLFIIFSYTFFRNSPIYGAWFYIFNIMWFYLKEQPDNRWFKYGYPILCVIFALLVLQSGKTEYWKLGHLCGVLCVYVDEKLSTLASSLISSYRVKKAQMQKDYAKNMEKQIDKILEKIYEFGLDSLSKIEKEILYKASKIYKDKLNKKN